MGRLVSEKLPRHLAIIPDGNGRWAEARGLPREEGHRRGTEVVREVVRTCHDLAIPMLTLYAFSQENWGRPRSEVESLMALLERFSYAVDDSHYCSVCRHYQGSHLYALAWRGMFGGIRQLESAVGRKRARPSSRLSQPLIRNTSSGVIRGA